ncbi:MAG: hypothetical protein IPL39_10930 [Opitutaceae bacterium]|nr:hypothetical protein [Opitutaceae bacterium]
MDLNRFRRYFPLAHWVIQRVWFLFPLFALAAMGLSVFSVHYGLSLMCCWIGVVCLWVDRKHLNYCLLTPLVPMAYILVLSLGAGISMVVYDLGGRYQYGYMVMQVIGLLGFPLFIVAYAAVMKRVPGFVFPAKLQRSAASYVRPLLLIGWFCLLHELAKVGAGIASGVADKGEAGDFQVDTPFGWWSAFGIFLRIQTLGYVLAPFIWRESRLFGRVLLMALLTTLVFLNFVTGSRGMVFAPVVILLAGCYMFLEFRRIKYEILIAVVVLAAVPVVTLMSHYRSTDAFRETSIRNPFAKLATIREGMERMETVTEASGERFTEAGKAFIGVNDAIIYELTPDTIPHEGFGRVEHLLWIYVPYMLSRGERPVLQDENMVSVMYTGQAYARSSIGITWSAELYRRWGWFGIPVGLCLYGLFYGAVFRVVYNYYLKRNLLFGFLICGVFFHFFFLWIFHTLLLTCWLWLYDVPKNLALVTCLYFGLRSAIGFRQSPGLWL